MLDHASHIDYANIKFIANSLSVVSVSVSVATDIDELVPAKAILERTIPCRAPAN